MGVRSGCFGNDILACDRRGWYRLSFLFRDFSLIGRPIMVSVILEENLEEAAY
jgi:hypothetical protein